MIPSRYNDVKDSFSLKIRKILCFFSACKLSLKGRNTEENPHVKMGAYHRLDLEMNRKFELKKTLWDTVSHQGPIAFA